MIVGEVRGRGPDVVFAHGMGVSRHMWQPQIDALSEQFRCISFDARGHGDSTADGVEPSVPQAVADLISAADAHAVSHCALVGASMGARTVIETTLAHPERVSALVISDVTEQSGEQAQQRLAYAAGALDTADDDGYAILSAGPGAADFIAHERRHGRVPFARHDRRTLASTLRNLSAGRPPLTELADDLAAITCPVLVVFGGNDEPSRAASRTVADLVPGAELVEIPGAGHLAALSAPAAYTEVVGDFLRRVTVTPLVSPEGTTQ